MLFDNGNKSNTQLKEEVKKMINEIKEHYVKQ
jgi:hypothetical protein